MPSDCQCSTACDVQTKYVHVEKVLNNKQATEKLKKLENEVKSLKMKNNRLKIKLNKATVNKNTIVKKLKRQLDES